MSIINCDFPLSRMRRLRSKSFIRSLIRETSLDISNLVQPIFIHEGKSDLDVNSMPGVKVFSIDSALKEAEMLFKLGIAAIAVFPRINKHSKQNNLEEAWNDKGIVPVFIKKVKKILPELGIIADVALDPYTVTGHDGIVDDAGYVLNDITIDALLRQAECLAESGADIIAPSDMMDGRIRAIREMLESKRYHNVMILAYSAKYASSFYSPFRDAVDSIQSQPISKNTYQMDISNTEESLYEIAKDIKEGADMVMVKPALPYLDIIKQAKEKFHFPIVAYQVSGEYSMLINAIDSNILKKEAVLEVLIAIKRAGARFIVTYFAKYAANMLK